MTEINTSKARQQLVIESPYGNGRAIFSQDAEAHEDVTIEVAGSDVVYADVHYDRVDGYATFHDLDSGRRGSAATGSDFWCCDPMRSVRFECNVDDLTDAGHGDTVEDAKTLNIVVMDSLSWELADDSPIGEATIQAWALFSPDTAALVSEMVVLAGKPPESTKMTKKEWEESEWLRSEAERLRQNMANPIEQEPLDLNDLVPDPEFPGNEIPLGDYLRTARRKNRDSVSSTQARGTARDKATRCGRLTRPPTTTIGTDYARHKY